MRVGIINVDLRIKDSRSLKDKRRVLRGLKDRLRKNLNVSVAEVDDREKWQKATLGISMVAQDTRFLDERLDAVMEYIREERYITVLEYGTEIL